MALAYFVNAGSQFFGTTNIDIGNFSGESIFHSDIEVSQDINMQDDKYIGIEGNERVIFDASEDDILIRGATKLDFTGSNGYTEFFLSSNAVNSVSQKWNNTEGEWGMFTYNGEFTIYDYGDSQTAMKFLTDQTARIPKIAAGAGTDYVCVDTNGDLSSGASCTQFENLVIDNTIVLNSNDHFKILGLKKSIYPEDHWLYAGETKNYFAQIAFYDSSDVVKGWIKIPGNLKNDKQGALYYLKKKIESHKYGNLELIDLSPSFIGSQVNMNNIIYNNETAGGSLLE